VTTERTGSRQEKAHPITIIYIYNRETVTRSCSQCWGNLIHGVGKEQRKEKLKWKWIAFLAGVVGNTDVAFAFYIRIKSHYGYVQEL
jgi:hypothetical protein